jgi:adenylate kinase family enzyme
LGKVDRVINGWPKWEMKIVLMGNAGAGKSTMAKQLVSQQAGNVARLSLNEVAWDSGITRNALGESRQLLQKFIETHDNWIIEGCYSDLIETALPFCDELRFLNPGIATCIRHCRSRPWEPERYFSPEEQTEMLEPLIQWLTSYDTRTDEFGLSRHRALFDGFPGKKVEYTSADEYTDQYHSSEVVADYCGASKHSIG